MPDTLDDEDESVRIAIRALGDMRNSRTEPVAPPSDTNSHFVARMTDIPLLNSALRVYEQGKASSRVVKYGAEMMESSVKTISRPVIDRLPVNVNQLDEFACRQLDRLDRYRRPSTSKSTNTNLNPEITPTSPHSSTDVCPPSTSQELDRPKAKLKSKTLDGSPDDEVRDERDTDDQALDKTWQDQRNGDVPSWAKAHSPFVGAAPRPPEGLTSSPSEERQVVSRSRWQAVLLEAGGLSAALSEESMRRLQYCLHWLQYATAHIDAQILILRDFTANLASGSSHGGTASISQAHLRTLYAVRRDIVQTIRQVVGVVSRYAGGALPEPARTRVRGFVLELPQRWARKAGAREEEGEIQRGGENRERESVVAAGGRGGVVPMRRGRRHRERGAASTPSSRAASPMGRHARHQEDAGDRDRETVSACTAIAAAQRILTLATESLDMVRGVTGVVKDSLDRADAWVGRLRHVGIQRVGTEEAGEGPEPSRFPPHTQGSFVSEESDVQSESGYGRQVWHHRRQSSGSHSVFDDLEGLSSPYSGGSSIYSIPSTPGGPGARTPAYGFNANGQLQMGGGGYSEGGGLVGPGLGLGLGAMSLADSRFSTPRSVVKVLGDEEEEGMGMGTKEGDGAMEVGRGRNRKESHAREVKIVGMDVESAGEDELGADKMEIDASCT